MRRHVSALGLAAVILASAGAAGSQEPASLESPARTPDGQPDIQGVWTNLDSTPLEAASAEAWRDLDALALWFPGINAPNGRLTGPNPSPDFGGEVTARQSAVRRSMVVDPPDGVLPIIPAAAAVRDQRLERLTDSWLFHTPWERCITRGVPGVMFPTYNAGHLSRLNDEYLLYEYTYDDAEVYTSTFSVSMPLRSTDNAVFEFACHEGNYGLMNILKGARAEEQAAEP